MIRIYVDTDVTTPKIRRRGRTWYLMEDISKNRIEQTVNSFTFDEHNVDGASLEGILNALNQIKTSGNQVELYIPSTIISVQIASGHEFIEAKRGFKTRKGKTIKYKPLWVAIVKQMIRSCKQIRCSTYNTDDLRQIRTEMQFLKTKAFDKPSKSLERVAFSEKIKQETSTKSVNPPNERK